MPLSVFNAQGQNLYMAVCFYGAAFSVYIIFSYILNYPEDEYNKGKNEEVTLNCMTKCSGCGAGTFKTGVCLKVKG